MINLMWVSFAQMSLVEHRLDFWISTDVRNNHSLVFKDVRLFFFFNSLERGRLSLVWIHRSSLARWRIQTAVWIYSGSFWASKCVRSETGRGGKGGENKFKGRLTDTTSICHLAPRTIKGLCEWSLLLEKRAAPHCWFLAAVDKLSKA